MKIAVIGGGSTYTPELINGFLRYAQELNLGELWLMDVDEARLKTVGEFARRMIEAQDAPFKVALSLDQRESVKGAAYVITQLRVGKMSARREDEYLAKRHNLIGQETTGIGGIAKALRTIPVILNLVRDMQELSPGALLANFSNPSGLITQAVSLVAPQMPIVGVCNVAIGVKMRILDGLQKKLGKKIDPDQAHLDTLGLNHLTWHRGFTLEGQDLWPEVLAEYLNELRSTEKPEFPPELIETLQMIPSYYLNYYYETGLKLAEQLKWPPSRAEEVLDLEKELLRDYADPARNTPPEGLMKRGGAFYSTAALQLINSHHNDLGQVHVANVPNRGAVQDWPVDWVLELPCRVNHKGIQAIQTRPLPEVCFGLLAQVKTCELITAKAAISGDRDLLYQALLAHPLGPSAGQTHQVMLDLLETNWQWLPQFFNS